MADQKTTVTKKSPTSYARHEVRRIMCVKWEASHEGRKFQHFFLCRKQTHSMIKIPLMTKFQHHKKIGKLNTDVKATIAEESVEETGNATPRIKA